MRKLLAIGVIVLTSAVAILLAWSIARLPPAQLEQAEQSFHVETDYLAEDRSGLFVPPYLQLPTPTSMTIMWETADMMPGTVEYGRTPELGTVKAYPGQSRIHQIKLEDLVPATDYYYRVRSGTLVSEIKRFRTAPPPGSGVWKMAVYGDSRSNPKMHRKVVEQIARHQVDLIVHTGDIVLNGKNHVSWRREFFGPIQPIAGSIPWVSTIGNHEEDSVNYFNYMALPGNERHFYFDYGNARIICLDSNSWMEKEGRGDVQRDWLIKHLKQPRAAQWTFVAFHHPLFSAHRDRPINPLRWDWSPILLDPEARIDGVLTGHDHFYARCFPISCIADVPVRGVEFITTAGGGANLYPLKKRDYVAQAEAVHHFTLFEFAGDRIDISAIDISGRVFDRHQLSKVPTPPELLCAYEVEELKEALRKVLAASPPVEISPNADKKWCQIDAALSVNHTFKVPVAGRLLWEKSPGWELPELESAFELVPDHQLRIPLNARVDTKKFGAGPKLAIEFEAGRFRNRTIELYPFKLTGGETVTAARVDQFSIDGALPKVDMGAEGGLLSWPLVLVTAGTPMEELSRVYFAHDGRSLFVSARLSDPDNRVEVTAAKSTAEGSKLVMLSDHLRVELHDGKHACIFALSHENLTCYSIDGKEKNITWPAAAARGDGHWVAEMAVPLDGLDTQNLRINVVHRHRSPLREYELRPGYSLGNRADIIPDWRPISKPENFARLTLR